MKKGFSLIELLVVITIISILATLATPSFNRAIRKTSYESSISKVVNLIKNARNNAIIGKFTQSGTTYTTPKGGYGVLIDKNAKRFTSFIDLDNSQSYNATDAVLVTYTLPDETEIANMTGSQSTLNYTGPNTTNNFGSGAIIFLPPQGDTVLNENSSGKTLLEMTVILQRYDNEKAKKITINRLSGFVETGTGKIVP